MRNLIIAFNFLTFLVEDMSEKCIVTAETLCLSWHVFLCVCVCVQLKSGGGGRRRGGQRHRGKGLNAATIPTALPAGAAGTA